MEPDNLHFTLKFFGEISDRQIEKIKEILDKIDFGQEFSIKISGLGAFPNADHINVLWLGLENGQKLRSLQEKIDSALSSLFPVEKEFVSHLTIARVKFVNDKSALRQFWDSRLAEFWQNIFKCFSRTSKA